MAALVAFCSCAVAIVGLLTWKKGGRNEGEGLAKRRTGRRSGG